MPFQKGVVWKTHEEPDYSKWGRDDLIERIIQLEEELGARPRYHLGHGFTATEAIMLSTIENSGGDVCSKDRMFTALYSHYNDPPEPKILDVFICKLRAKLRHHGIEFTTVWGRGWYMDDENRAKLVKFRFPPGVDIDSDFAPPSNEVIGASQ